MVQATSENVFLGSVVEKGGERYNVYKVNSTTVWAGGLKTAGVLEVWKDMPKGKKWLDYMKSIKATQIKINSIKVDDEKTENTIIVEKKEKDGDGKRVKYCCKRQLATLNEAKKAGKSYRHLVHCNCGKSLRILKVGEDGRFWLGTGYDYIWFDPSTKEEEYISTIGAA